MINVHWMLSGKLNDALSGRLFYADFGFPQGEYSCPGQRYLSGIITVLWENCFHGLSSCRKSAEVKQKQQMCKPTVENGGQKIRWYL